MDIPSPFNLDGTEALIAVLAAAVLSLGIIMLAGRRRRARNTPEPLHRCYYCGGSLNLAPINSSDFMCDGCAARILLAMERELEDAR